MCPFHVLISYSPLQCKLLPGTKLYFCLHIYSQTMSPDTALHKHRNMSLRWVILAHFLNHLWLRGWPRARHPWQRGYLHRCCCDPALMGLAGSKCQPWWGILEVVSRAQVPGRKRLCSQEPNKHPFISHLQPLQCTSQSPLHCCPSLPPKCSGNGKMAPDQAPTGQMTQTQNSKPSLCPKWEQRCSTPPPCLANYLHLCKVSVIRTTHACSCQAQWASPSCFQVTSLIGPSYLAVGRKEYFLPTSHRRSSFHQTQSLRLQQIPLRLFRLQ